MVQSRDGLAMFDDEEAAVRTPETRRNSVHAEMLLGEEVGQVNSIECFLRQQHARTHCLHNAVTGLNEAVLGLANYLSR